MSEMDKDFCNFGLDVRPAPKIQVTWGELVDRTTILEIKLQRITSNAALAHVRRELSKLLNLVIAAEKEWPQIATLRLQLRQINENLWDIEDAIRRKEASKSFDQEFVSLARSVYMCNDERWRLKRAIDCIARCELLEEKLYAKY